MLHATCSIDGCDRRSRARGWCVTHYKRWERNGSPELNRPSELERFWNYVDKHSSPLGCWLWTGATLRGYARFKTKTAYRFAYEHLVGPIPEGLDIDHLCRVKACVNPDHLEPVTRKVNIRRGVEARRIGDDAWRARMLS
jgi:hypothetical protein